MIQNVIRSLGGIDRYGVLSLCIFGSIFIGVLVWTLLQKKSHLDRMARFPLEKDPEDSTATRLSHE